MYASNLFGNGPPSQTVVTRKLYYRKFVQPAHNMFTICAFLDADNHFVDANLEITGVNKITLNCMFVNQRAMLRKTCIVDYGPKTTSECYNGDLTLSSTGNSSTSDIVQVHLHSLKYYENVLCYRLTATDGINTVQVIGTITGMSINYYLNFKEH